MQAGFGQIEYQVMKVGMAAEAACISKPWDHYSDARYWRSGLRRGGSVPWR